MPLASNISDEKSNLMILWVREMFHVCDVVTIYILEVWMQTYFTIFNPKNVQFMNLFQLDDPICALTFFYISSEIINKDIFYLI